MVLSPDMRRVMLTCAAILLFAAGASAQQAVVAKYCVTCHNEKLRTADLFLDKADISHPAENPAIWEKVLHKLRSREMPPPRAPRPDEATYESLTSYLE